MQVHYDFQNLSISNAVVTTGSFDGVHVGHKTILKRLCLRAAELGGESVLVTFYPHPRKVLYPDTLGKNLKMIHSQEEKILLLEQLGLDHLIIVNFTPEFSRISSLQFVRNFLIKELNTRHVIIGFNHHFGHNREGDLEHLMELGIYYHFTVEEIPEQDIQNETVSSTKIRKALNDGNIQRANAYLDHPYILTGSARNPEEDPPLKTWKIGYQEEEKLLPPPGGYAVSLDWRSLRIKAAVWIGPDSGQEQSLSLAFAEEPGLINGQKVRLFFHKRISENYPGKSGYREQKSRDISLIQDLIY